MISHLIMIIWSAHKFLFIVGIICSEEDFHFDGNHNWSIWLATLIEGFAEFEWWILSSYWLRLNVITLIFKLIFCWDWQSTLHFTRHAVKNHVLSDNFWWQRSKEVAKWNARWKGEFFKSFHRFSFRDNFPEVAASSLPQIECRARPKNWR